MNPPRLISLPFLFITIASFIIPDKSFGQSEQKKDLIIKQLDVKNGVSSSINDLHLDKDNNLWIVQVQHDVLKYNGIIIDRFPLTSQIKSIVSVSNIVITKENDLKLNSLNSSALLQTKNDSLEFFKHLDLKEELIQNRFYLDKSHLNRFFNTFPYLCKSVKSIDSLSKLNQFFVMDYDSYIYKYKDSIYYFHLNTTKNITPITLNKSNILRIFKYQDHLIEFYKNKFYLIDPDKNLNTEITLNKSFSQTLDTFFRKNLNKDPNLTFFNSPGIFNIADINYIFEIISISGNKMEIRTVLNFDFIQSKITQIVKSSIDGTYFISTNSEGLYIVKKNPFFYSFDKDYEVFNKRMIYYPLTLTHDKGIFNAWGVIYPAPHSMRIVNKLARSAWALMRSTDNTYWESNTHNLISRYDSSFKLIKEYNYGIDDNENIHMIINKKNELIVLSQKWISKFSNNQFVLIDNFSNVIPKNTVFVKIIPLSNNNYIITSNNGIYYYNSESHRLEKEKLYANQYIISVTPTQKGDNFIVHDANNKFIHYNYKNKFYEIPVPSNSGLLNIASITIDHYNKIWIGTDNSLYVTTLTELDNFCENKAKSVFFYTYDYSDGIKSPEFAGGLHESSLLTPDGYLAFNTLKGLLLFHEDSVKQFFPSTKAFIKSIKLGENTIYSLDTIESKGLNAPLKFTVYTPYYGNPANLLMEYAIGNSPDQEWKTIKNNEFTISGLKIGTTFIRIRLKNGFGEQSYYYTTCTIINQPYFYQTSIFAFTACTLFLFLFALVMNTFRKSSMRKKIIKANKEKITEQNQQLESKTQLLESTIKQMEKAIIESNDSKSKLNESIQLKEKFISLIIHDLKSPLYSQSILLNHLLASNQNQNNKLSPIIADLKASNNAILNFTKDFLLWFSMQENGFSVNHTSFQLRDLIDEILILYSEISKQKSVPLNNNVTPQLLVSSDRILLEIILRNVIDNALKYTEEGKIDIYTRNNEETIEIIITDTGVGIKSETLNIIKDIKNEKALSSFGYRFIQTLSLKISAQIEIAQNQPKGTIVIVQLPKTVSKEILLST